MEKELSELKTKYQTDMQKEIIKYRDALTKFKNDPNNNNNLLPPAPPVKVPPIMPTVPRKTYTSPTYVGPSTVASASTSGNGISCHEYIQVLTDFEVIQGSDNSLKIKCIPKDTSYSLHALKCKLKKSDKFQNVFLAHLLV